MVKHLVERATRTKDGMYKRTSAAEVAYILKRVEEDKAAHLAEMEKAAKSGRARGKLRMGVLPMAGARRKPWEGLPRKSLQGITLSG